MIHDESINNKLLLLFVLDKMEVPISEELLVQLCAEDNEWIPPLYCSEIVKELISAGFITKTLPTRRNPVAVLRLTEDGRTCLSHFFNDIPKSVRDTVSNYIKNNRIEYRKKQEFGAKYERTTDGQYVVELSIMETTGEVFNLRYVVPTLNCAVSFTQNWTSKAPEVYKLFLDILQD